MRSALLKFKDLAVARMDRTNKLQETGTVYPFFLWSHFRNSQIKDRVLTTIFGIKFRYNITRSIYIYIFSCNSYTYSYCTHCSEPGMDSVHVTYIIGINH